MLQGGGKPWAEFRWDRGLKGEPLTVLRVDESEPPGVKHETAGAGLAAGTGVDFIPQQRVPEVAHVDTDLVGATSVEGALHESIHPGGVEDFIVSVSMLPGWRLNDRHTEAVARIAGDVSFHRPGALGRDALNDGEVDFSTLRPANCPVRLW